MKKETYYEIISFILVLIGFIGVILRQEDFIYVVFLGLYYDVKSDLTRLKPD